MDSNDISPMLSLEQSAEYPSWLILPPATKSEQAHAAATVSAFGDFD